MLKVFTVVKLNCKVLKVIITNWVQKINENPKSHLYGSYILFLNINRFVLEMNEERNQKFFFHIMKSFPPCPFWALVK